MSFPLAASVVIGAAAFTAATASEPTAPVDRDLSEHVEVRLVTIDVIALDPQDRTIPGLGKDAFQLYVDGKETPIDTLDVVCGDAPESDPKTKKFGQWTTPPDLASGTRRIVLAFDYLHLGGLPVQVLDAYRWTLAHKSDIHDEEIMVVALTGGVRVEQPFTRDRAAVLETLRRMQYDITLWNGHFEPLTEFSFFRSLGVLMTLLHAVPGPKSVVLLTAHDGPGNSYDNEFAAIATAASDSQASVYPVDCDGLTADGVGPPPGWTRLAVETGGRITAGVNDFTLGYARARRDQGCRYTIGFYDRHPEENKTRRLRVDSAKTGVRIYHAMSYSFPSQKVRRAMAIEAAFMVPSMFSDGGMRAAVFPIAPKSRKTWDAVVAIDFPVPSEIPGDSGAHEFGVMLSDTSGVGKQFSRAVTLKRKIHRLTFLEAAELPPGTYGLTAVLSTPGGADPFTAHTEVAVPEIPKRGPFLVGPMIGRPAGSDLVVLGGESAEGAPADQAGGPKSFRPLLVTESDRSVPLFALTRACAWKKDAKRGPWHVSRRVAAETGEVEVERDDTFSSAADEPFVCARYLDLVPVDRLALGAHTFTATVTSSDPARKTALDSRVARFLLTSDEPK